MYDVSGAFIDIVGSLQPPPETAHIARLTSSQYQYGYTFNPRWDSWEEGDALFRERIKRLTAAHLAVK